MSVCSRTGCTKTLNKNNTTGMCGSGCESMDAPPAKRAGNLKAAAKRVEAVDDEVMVKFRKVAEMVGKDPDEMVREYAQAWLDGIRETLES